MALASAVCKWVFQVSVVVDWTGGVLPACEVVAELHPLRSSGLHYR